MSDTTRLSFPSKLVTYVSSGCRVLLHAPVDASPTKFLAGERAVAICTHLDPTAILDALSRLLRLADADVRQSCHQLWQQHFSEMAMDRALEAAFDNLLPRVAASDRAMSGRLRADVGSAGR